MTFLPVLAALACCLVAGCGGSEETSVRRGSPPLLSDGELSWIRRYSAVALALHDEDGNKQSPRTRRLCLAQRGDTGVAPTSRLGQAARLVRRACARAAEGDRDAALDLVGEADESLRPLFLDARPLAVASGRPTRTSRIDLDLGGLVSERAGMPVEVRCWSSGDWARMISEDNAWEDTDDDPLDIVGQADVDGGRMHLPLETCNLINDLADVVGRDPVEAAAAVETVAHEIEHFRAPDASEAEVECAAIRAMGSLAQALGLEWSIAAMLKDQYVDEVVPTLDEEYRAVGCDL